VTAVQPRVPPGTREGGRFASASCPAVYALLDSLAAGAPEPEPSEANPIVEVAPGRYRIWAPKCPHGSFRWWADAVAPGCKVQRNCRACHPPRRGPSGPRSVGEER
jgi:hypothetical protein